MPVECRVATCQKSLDVPPKDARCMACATFKAHRDYPESNRYNLANALRWIVLGMCGYSNGLIRRLKGRREIGRQINRLKQEGIPDLKAIGLKSDSTGSE